MVFKALRDSCKTLTVKQRFLLLLMPVGVGYRGNDRNQHGECLVSVCFEDRQEIVVLEEAHGSVGNLQVRSGDRFDQSLEQSWDQRLQSDHIANFKNFQKFCKEGSLLSAVGKRPVSQQAIN
jgi:hypothetical protein